MRTAPRLGFLGVGWIGRSRMETLVGEGVAIAAAVADPSVDGALDTLDDLLAHELDGIVIATPSALHGQQAIAALAAGLPVFVQKPLGLTAAEVEAVLEAARRSDLLVGVDLSYREAEAFRVARDVVRSGGLGDVYAAELVFHNAYAPDRSWARDPALAGGGCLIDLGVHLVDLAVWTLGLRPRSVRCRRVGDPLETYAAAELDGVRLACSWDFHAGRDAIIGATFHGTAGGVSVSNVDGSFYDFRCELLHGSHTEVLVEPPDAWPGRAAVRWARRVADGAGFDEAEAAQQLHVAAILDRLYAR